MVSKVVLQIICTISSSILSIVLYKIKIGLVYGWFGWLVGFRKQCLFDQDRHRHVTNKGMDSYQLAIGHMEVRPDR